MDHMFLASTLYTNIYVITLQGKKWDVTLPLGKQFTKICQSIYTYYYASQVSYQVLNTTLNKPIRTLPNISIYVCKIQIWLLCKPLEHYHTSLSMYTNFN